MCNSISCVGKVATDRQYQEQMFDQVYDILIDSLDIQVFLQFLCNSISCVGKVAIDRQYQEQMFDQVYDILIDSLDIQVTSTIIV